jgi:hypothetical protein
MITAQVVTKLRMLTNGQLQNKTWDTSTLLIVILWYFWQQLHKTNFPLFHEMKFSSVMSPLH